MMTVVASLDVVRILILSFLGEGADNLAEVERKEHPNEVSAKDDQIGCNDDCFSLAVVHLARGVEHQRLIHANDDTRKDDHALAEGLVGIGKMVLVFT